MGSAFRCRSETLGSFLCNEDQMMPKVIDVFVDHFCERNQAAFGVNAGSLKCRVRQGSQYDSRHCPVFLEEIAGHKRIQLVGARQLTECCFVVATKQWVVHTSDALHSVGADQVTVQHMDRDLM